MPLIEIHTQISAPIERVFDLSRSIELHEISTGNTGEKAIAGRMQGLIGLGESVTWKAKHFGVWQTLSSKITAFENPTYFVDEMVHGAFKCFKHEHIFEQNSNKTYVTDKFNYTSPLGFLGIVADNLFLKAYLTRLLQHRNQVIKKYAQSDD